MFPWISRQIIQKSAPFNLEAQVECSFEDEADFFLSGKAFFAQFSGAPGTDEARSLANRDQLDLAAEALFEYFQIRYKPIFFVHNSEAAAIRSKILPHQDTCKAIKRAGAAALNHTFSPFGIAPFTFNTDIDWFSDFCGHSWPRLTLKQYRQAFSAPSELAVPNPAYGMGPLAVNQEFNRHFHFVDLARAYWLTGYDNYAAEFLIQAVSWANANPIWKGVSWLDMDSVACRTLNWLLAINMCMSSKQFTPEIFVKVMQCLIMHGQALAWHLTYDSCQSLAAASALFILSDHLPEFKLSHKWHTLAEEALERCAAQEFGKDCMHLSGSTAKHRQVSEWLLLLVSYMTISNTSLPPFLLRLCRESLVVIMAMLGTDQKACEIGFDVGRTFFSFNCTPYQHAQNMLALGGITLGSSDLLWDIAEMPPELYWWLGASADKLFQDAPAEAPESRIFYLVDTGIGMARDHWQEKASQLIVRGCAPADYSDELYRAPGPQAPLMIHRDFQSFSLRIDGEPLIMEPGCPHQLSALARPLSSPTVHSGPHIEGEILPTTLTYSNSTHHTENSAFYSPLFIEVNKSDCILFSSKREVILPDQQRAFITRTWFYDPQEKCVIVRDRVEGPKNAEVTFCSELLLAPHLSMIMRGDMGCTLRGKKSIARLTPIFPRGTQSNTIFGREQPFFAGWFYNARLFRTKQLHFSTKIKLPYDLYFAIDWSRKERRYNIAEVEKRLSGK